MKKFEELSRRYSSLPQNGAQSASLDGAVLGDDHGPAIRMPVDDVTVFRAHVDKAKRLDNTGILRIGRSESAGLTLRPAPGTW